MRILRESRGFTLIEVLIVVAILAIIAVVVIPNIARFIRPDTSVVEVTLPSVQDAPFKVVIYPNCAKYAWLPQNITCYCPAGGYKLLSGCVLFSKYYYLLPGATSYNYFERLKMYCDYYVVRVEVIDRRLGA